jgi:curli production assembly/transport component CsgG
MLRAIDIKSGRILKTISTSKTVLSRELTAGLFRYVSFKRLLEAEAGFTTNEPVQLAVQGAIEKAVGALVIEGIIDNLWALKDPKDMKNEVIKDYLDEAEGVSYSEEKVQAAMTLISSFEEAEERKSTSEEAAWQ